MIPHPLPSTRSKVTNGKKLFTGEVDGRTVAAKRFRDVLSQIASDLGGSENLSEAQRQLSRRASLLSVQCELMEADAILGKEIDLDAYGMMTDRLGRAFTRLGIKRVARVVDINPLAEHFSRPVARPAA